MKGQQWANLTAITGILAGVAAIAGGLYAHSAKPVFGIPNFFGIHSHYLSGVYVLVGIGVVMVVGGALAFRWPSIGGIIVCAAAMIGLIYTYDRGQYRWTPLLYYWGAPWVLAWLSGIFAGYAAFRNVPQVDEPLYDTRRVDDAGA